MTGRTLLGGGCIGGLKETQEMIDFVAKHNITRNTTLLPWTELLLDLGGGGRGEWPPQIFFFKYYHINKY